MLGSRLQPPRGGHRFGRPQGPVSSM